MIGIDDIRARKGHRAGTVADRGAGHGDEVFERRGEAEKRGEYKQAGRAEKKYVHRGHRVKVKLN